ncbi:MAG: choice-of-anchor Q domain-containing protein [Chloroflexota bacterium]
MALGPISAAIDRGDPATCGTADQRGTSRPVDGNSDGTAVCNIGAFEAPVGSFDAVAPLIQSIKINGGAVTTTSASVNVLVTAIDTASGVQDVSFSNDGAAWSNWLPAAQTNQFTLAAGDGLKTINARVRDRAGNVSAMGTAAIHLDTAAGSEFGLTINDGAIWSNSTGVNLTISAQAGTTEMQISNDGGFAGAQWQPYNARKTWTLIHYGTYVIQPTVYVRFKNASGTVITATFSDRIILDATAPTGSVTGPPLGTASNGSGSVSAQGLVTLTLTASDDAGGSGLAGVRIGSGPDISDGAWQPFQSSVPWNLNEHRNAYVQFKDRAGNLSPIYGWPHPPANGLPAAPNPGHRSAAPTGGLPPGNRPGR